MSRRHRKAMPDPIAQPSRPEAPAALAEIGTSGLRATRSGIGSWIHDDSRRRTYAQRIALYREMGRTPVFGAAMFIMRTLLAQIDYAVQPRGGSADSTLRLRADFVRDALDDMGEAPERSDWDVWSCIQYGLAPFEVVYKQRRGPEPRGGEYTDAAGFAHRPPASRYSDGLIGLERFAYRFPGTVERWMLDANMGVRGIVQRDPNTGAEVPIPEWKLLRFTFGGASNPLGDSAFDPCVGVYGIWKSAVESEGIGVTRRLAGTPVGTAPAEWLAPSQPNDGPHAAAYRAAGAQFHELLRTWQADPNAYLMLPYVSDGHGGNQVRVELIGMSGDAGVDTNAIITRHELRMASALLASMIFLGQSTGGTQALAKEQSDLLRACLNTLGDMRAAAITQQVFRPLMRLNGWPESEAPELVAQRLKSVPTFAELSAGIASLATAGLLAWPDGTLGEEWRARGGLPPMSAEDVQRAMSDQASRPTIPDGGDAGDE